MKNWEFTLYLEGIKTACQSHCKACRDCRWREGYMRIIQRSREWGIYTRVDFRFCNRWSQVVSQNTTVYRIPFLQDQQSLSLMLCGRRNFQLKDCRMILVHRIQACLYWIFVDYLLWKNVSRRSHRPRLLPPPQKKEKIIHVNIADTYFDTRYQYPM